MNKSKSALVTGGTKGIGYSIAKTLSASGIKVTITGTKNISDYSAEQQKSFAEFQYIKVNFIQNNELEHFLNDIEKNNQFDILINNAGINVPKPFLETDQNLLNDTFQVNLKVPILLTQKILPYMIENKFGRIINIASIWSQAARANRLPYTVTKFGLDGFTISLAAEFSKFNIITNTISPGFIDTELTRKNLGPSEISTLLSQIPMGHLGSTQNIAEFIVWLVSDTNTYICGQNIVIDGGFLKIR